MGTKMRRREISTLLRLLTGSGKSAFVLKARESENGPRIYVERKMTNEPELFADETSPSVHPDVVAAKQDLESISEEDFQGRYKATKRQYRSLVTAMEALTEVYAALSQPCPMEIDSEILDNTRYLMEDIADLMEQMHSASYWEQEGMGL